jgi:nucleotide-binding universal stress UspA family protein
MKMAGVSAHIQLKNILFATDFSAASNAAVPYAAELAKRYGAKIHALHVRPPVVNPMTPPRSWKAVEEAAKIEAEQQTRALVKSFAGIQPEILIEEGDLWSNLAKAIQEKKVDLIVMGTRGRSGVGKFLLGSSAEEVFRQAPCPVLTVGPHSPAKGPQGGEFTRIVFATDFSPESVAALPYAVSLAQECQAYLTLLHVVAEPKGGELVHAPELTRSFTQLLHNLVPSEAELWCVPEYVIERGEVAETILNVAAQSKADLIVLGVRQPSGFPGAATHLPIAIAHKVVSHASCPVLTVRG